MDCCDRCIARYGTSKNPASFWTQFSSGWECWLHPSSFDRNHSRNHSHNLTTTGIFGPAPPALPPMATCNEAMPLMILFIGAYIGTYVFGAMVMDAKSANTASLLMSICNPLGTLFWVVFKPAAEFCGGGAISPNETIYALVSVPVIIIGAILFMRNEPDKRARGNSANVDGHSRSNTIQDNDDDRLLSFGDR